MVIYYYMKIRRENQPIIHTLSRLAVYVLAAACCAAAVLLLIRGVRSGAAVQAPVLYETAVTGEPVLIDLNTADAETLALLPGIGQTRAQAVIAYREENGPFDEPSQVTEVYGIGPAIFAGIEPYVTCQPQTP